tara:strand:+ start:730 stop:4737 length:4008 start_codon:yes stop_codon:yes gene_type:complete
MSKSVNAGIKNLLKLYLIKSDENKRNYRTTTENYELELRYGTKRIKQITKNDFDNVIEKLLSQGYEKRLDVEPYTLKIQVQYLDPNIGDYIFSKTRVEINGLDTIQEYCRTNTITEKMIEDGNVNFISKNYIENQLIGDNDDEQPANSGTFKKKNKVFPVDINEYNARIALQHEVKISPQSQIVQSILKEWANSKKIFRYIYRASYTDSRFKSAYQYDLSIVKSSSLARGNRIPEPTFTLEQSNVLNNQETYEIEQEHQYEEFNYMDKVNKGDNVTIDEKVDILYDDTKKAIKLVQSAIQKTNYPITMTEQNTVLQNYVALFDPRKIHNFNTESKKRSAGNKNFTSYYRALPREFIGPSSYTLQINNIVQNDENSKETNIRNDYSVTEKADGIRKLLYIARNSKIYMIDMNMDVQFTGTKTDNENLLNTLIDGEHILHDKTGKYINLFAAFDVYFINGNDCRNNNFYENPNSEETAKPENKSKRKTRKETKDYCRYLILKYVTNKIELQSINAEKLSPMKIITKEFHTVLSSNDSPDTNIFTACSRIMHKIKTGGFSYETDGLIFTPCYGGVGVDADTRRPVNYKKSWSKSFKWKPAHFNTIDFLITVDKRENGSDIIKNIFEQGKDLSSGMDEIIKYKTLTLRVGFDENKHGYINPVNSVLRDEEINNDEGTYRPVPFYPTDPYDDSAHKCNIKLKTNSIGNSTMYTEEGEAIEDKTIVEFRYDKTKPKHWRWVPIRVRYDKTAEFRKGQKNYGNAYHTANNNWQSIHRPITEAMISTGNDIPLYTENKEVYYNRKKERVYNDLTKSLRDFHNLYVKQRLINISNPGDSLIDYAVGKGGDWPKWIKSRLSFIFGIDISKDNIENRVDGIYSRYLNYRKTYHSVPYGLFIQGDSAKNIKAGDVTNTPKEKQIINSVFGNGPKDPSILGQGVYDNFGKGSDGFNISSCQFAIHYFFKDIVSICGFLRNVSECTKINGHFVGTCYDGLKIFSKMRNKVMGESVQLNKKEHMIWKITKNYAEDVFNNDHTSLGLAIDVYQESINKTFREYLVNFNYFDQLLQHFGFAKITDTEANDFGLPGACESFNILFNEMNKDQTTHKIGSAKHMSKEEKEISFYGRYFVYKKIRDVDTVNLEKTLIEKVNSEMANINDEDLSTKEVMRLKNLFSPNLSLINEEGDEGDGEGETSEQKSADDRDLDENTVDNTSEPSEVKSAGVSEEKEDMDDDEEKSAGVSEEKEDMDNDDEEKSAAVSEEKEDMDDDSAMSVPVASEIQSSTVPSVKPTLKIRPSGQSVQSSAVSSAKPTLKIKPSRQSGQSAVYSAKPTLKIRPSGTSSDKL